MLRVSTLIAMLASVLAPTARAADPDRKSQLITAIDAAEKDGQFSACAAHADELLREFGERQGLFRKAECQRALGGSHACAAKASYEEFLLNSGNASRARRELAQAHLAEVTKACEPVIVPPTVSACREAHDAEQWARCVDACPADEPHAGGLLEGECLAGMDRCKDAVTTLEAWLTVQAPTADEKTRADKVIADCGAKSRRTLTPPKKPDDGPGAGPWVLVVGGGLGIALGVTGFLVAEDRYQQFVDAKGANDTVDLTETQARSLESQSHDWWAVGVVAGAVGLVAAGAGIVWLATAGGDEPETRGSVNLSGGPIPGGALVILGSGF